MLEQNLRILVQEFKTAIYGKDVRRTFADIAELICIRAMQQLDHAVEQGNTAEQQGSYAKEQGDYAKEQGDYAKGQGDYAGEQTNTALTEINSVMLQITNEFSNMQETLRSTENGALLLEINELLQDMYRTAIDEDIDKIIDGRYVDEDNEGSIFEAGSTQDIDDIIGGTYVGYEETSVTMINAIT